MPKVIDSEPVMFFPFGYNLMLFLLLLNEMIQLNLYHYKISRTISEWGEKIHTIYPQSIGHRYLLNEILTHVNCALNDEKINSYQNILKTHTEITEFFDSEMRNMSLSLSSGVSALWLFMKQTKLHYKQIQEMVHTKIAYSEIWTKKDSVLVDDGLFDGLPGIILTYQKICKHA